MPDRLPYPPEFYPGCPCFACDSPTWTNKFGPERMSLCPTCGNKRCPGAIDHHNACTGSNAAGQDHLARCCTEHGTHVMPHKGCILR